MAADFSGYATKAGLKCTDGRTIMPDAFKGQDGQKVPLVWQHGHNEPANILGHAVLENREDGVYCYGFFNDTEQGKSAKALVQHGDITALSIYANRLVERSKQVLHGAIREVSLVLSGANPGALIDNVAVAHADGDVEVLEEEAVIYTGLPLSHSDDPAKDETKSEETLEHAEEKTVQDVYDSLTEEQKTVVAFIVGTALEESAAKHSDDNTNTAEETLEHKEGNEMSRNVFEQKTGDEGSGSAHVLTHSDIQSIVSSAQKSGSMKAAVEEYALAHGIDNIDLLFPEAKNISNTPEWDKRRTEWVAGVLNGVRKSPFSRIKTMSADITHDEARAKGYVKGSLKKEEFFSVAKRVTTPTTIYKKQKLDRDDIVDITDFDVVAWMKGEMRLMLEEELARAVLIGDGRDVADEDKINENNIRPISKEDELYATTIYVNLDDANSKPSEITDTILRNRKWYKGSGTPTFYTTEDVLNKLLLERDQMGRRLYRTVDELANELRVGSIVTVESMEDEPDLVGIIVNLQDYVLGADRGGEVNMFDDFDIDYNQFKYLIETRVSGALVKIKAALVIRKTTGTNVLVVPAEPTFDPTTGALTITDTTGVVYKHDATTLTAAGSPYTVPAGTTWVVQATPAAGYYFETSVDSWTYTADA